MLLVHLRDKDECSGMIGGWRLEIVKARQPKHHMDT